MNLDTSADTGLGNDEMQMYIEYFLKIISDVKGEYGWLVMADRYIKLFAAELVDFGGLVKLLEIWGRSHRSWQLHQVPLE